MREGELVFGVARIFASEFISVLYAEQPLHFQMDADHSCSPLGFNDTFVHVTDLS